MKKLLLAVAFFSFLGLTSASACEDGKVCDKKDCKNKKECTTKETKKACCAKGKESAGAKSSCTEKDKAAGKSCCAAKAKTEEKKEK